MNTTHPDLLLQLSHQKIEKDRAFIIKEKMFKTDPDFGSALDKLGSWMIAKGEKLHKKYAASGSKATFPFLQDQSSVFKA